MTTTFERLRTILIKDYMFTPDLLVLDAPLEELGIDSLGTAELLFNIEDEFGVTLPPDAVQLTTLGDVVGFIDGLIVAQHKSKIQTDPIADLVLPAV
ncbi:acyl carrier protein [Rhodoferax lithotrophicus]|uniref:Acyl carrier protein n=1 Tax=Rhodoferax lithotrophicus TaxID=2798804 RepID=A0ABN6D7P8_9BURK|nr:phosphopantetheine-binding protein [Rhodoferax sp. MIZ03]BCO28035.1 acyl carrier protein [Rhodoferax sp. MIZ03]